MESVYVHHYTVHQCKYVYVWYVYVWYVYVWYMYTTHLPVVQPAGEAGLCANLHVCPLSNGYINALLHISYSCCIHMLCSFSPASLSFLQCPREPFADVTTPTFCA